MGVRRRPIGRSPVWAQVAGRLLRGDDVLRAALRPLRATASAQLAPPGTTPGHRRAVATPAFRYDR